MAQNASKNGWTDSGWHRSEVYPGLELKHSRHAETGEERVSFRPVQGVWLPWKKGEKGSGRLVGCSVLDKEGARAFATGLLALLDACDEDGYAVVGEQKRRVVAPPRDDAPAADAGGVKW